MRTLVTGSAGFIGSRFQCNHIGIDSRRFEDLQKIVEAYSYTKLDRIFHLGAISGIEECEKNKDLALSLNVNATLLYLELARKLNAQLIFASSTAASGESFYGMTKRIGENLCYYYRDFYGLDIKILRLSNVYGPGSINKNSVVAKMFKDALTKGAITAVTDVSRDFIYVDDVVKGFEKASQSYSKRYSYVCTSYVCTGVRTKITDLAELISDMTGASIIVKDSEYSPANLVESQLEIDYTKLSEGLELTHHYFKEQLK